MSRIGKKAIPLPKGVEVKVDNGHVVVKGAKGTLEYDLPPAIGLQVSDNDVVVTCQDENNKQAQAFHGLARALINNMVTGVSEGFKKELEIQGVGYRSELKGKTLILSLGYSRPIEFKVPDDVTVEVDPKRNVIAVSGIDKQKVGQVAADIRNCRPPDAYKGKGIRYLGEHISLKEGKRA